MQWETLLKYLPLASLIAFCVVTTIILFYYLFIFIRLSWYKPKAAETSQTHPVSVIVCARDEAGNLVNNLPGILVQQYPTTHEVIVVNDNSHDDSKYVLEELQRSFRQLHIVELKQEAKMIPGKKFPLSVGIKTAKHEITLLTDADCVPATEHWIQSMQAAYQPQTEIVLGYSPYFKKSGLLNKLIRWETYHTALQYMSYALAGMPYMGVGRNLSYKKSVFFRHKGFSSHHHVPGGDDDLFINMAANANNTRINTDPDSFVLSEPVSTWSQWLRQKSRHYNTSKYYQPLHKFLLGLYAFCNFLFYPMAVVAAIFYSWQITLAIVLGKWIIQAVVHYPAMKKLQVLDLFPLFIFFDFWLMIYYIIFAPALIKKPRETWK